LAVKALKDLGKHSWENIPWLDIIEDKFYDEKSFVNTQPVKMIRPVVFGYLRP